MTERGAERGVVREGRSSRRPGAKPTVLLVEDDSATMEVVGVVLEGEGYAVVPALTISDAFSALSLDPPDAILLDLLLEGRSTVPVIEQARTLRVPQQIVVYSGSLANGAGVTAHYGASFVTKPFDLEDLLSALDDALG